MKTGCSPKKGLKNVLHTKIFMIGISTRVRYQVTSLGWLGPPEVSKAILLPPAISRQKFCDMEHLGTHHLGGHLTGPSADTRADMAASCLLFSCPLMTFSDPPQSPRTGPHQWPGLPRDLHFSALSLGAALTGGNPAPPCFSLRPGRPKDRLAVMPEARKP